MFTFERYTEKARRVIFFARFEASQYGASSINTEHILLGLLREDHALMQRFRLDLAPEIRDEIDKVVQRGERVSTSVEMPLSAESAEVLTLADEEADRLCTRHIGTEHILLALLRVENSLAAKLLTAKGATVDAVREQLALGAASLHETAERITWMTPFFPGAAKDAVTTLHEFLGLLKAGASDQLADFFHQQGQFVDSSGKRWFGRDEIAKGTEMLLAPFAKRNASFRVEDITRGPAKTEIASVIWEFAAVSGNRSKSLLRMSMVLAPAEEGWTILLAQTTPVAL